MSRPTSARTGARVQPLKAARPTRAGHPQPPRTRSFLSLADVTPEELAGYEERAELVQWPNPGRAVEREHDDRSSRAIKTVVVVIKPPWCSSSQPDWYASRKRSFDTKNRLCVFLF